MKSIQLWTLAGLAIAAQSGFAQTADRVKLSSATPAMGKTITFTYDTTGAALGGVPEAVVYFQDNKDNPTVDVALKPEGKLYKGEFTIPATAKSFFVRLANGENVDNNGGKGYLYPVYKGNKPVQGAYAMEAYVIQTGLGNYFGKISPDKPKVVELYKSEFAAYPQSKTEYALTYLNGLAAATSATDAAFLAEKEAMIATLGKSKNEKELIALANLFARDGKKDKADSLFAIIKTKYPKGDYVRGNAGTDFYKEKDVTRKDSILQAYVASYGKNKDNDRVIEIYRAQLAAAYLQAGNYEGFKKYADMVSNKSMLASGLNSVAWAWAEKGENLEKAAEYSKLSLDYMDQSYANPTPVAYQSASQIKAGNRNNYYTYEDTYAFILYKQGNYAEALKHQQSVYDNSKYPDAEVSEHYALILTANKQYAKAKDIIEQALKNGKGSDALRTSLKEIYTSEKGSDAGFDNYVASLDAAAKVKMREELAKTMIKQTAPAFALKDFDGKEVSLASLKGKVVVLDFWATWCGPCKASFPGMQMAVNKYKDDANVKFLFIDTWESAEDYFTGVKKFIADNKYTFHVLFDEKDANGKQAKVVSAYGVEGIPTKFVIDKNGDIRFKHVGFSGTADGVMNEVSNMIDMLLSPDSAKASAGEQEKASAGK